MKDLVVEEILRHHLTTTSKSRRGYTQPVIPAANRYPHSLRRAELELMRQPWSQAMLGKTQGGYRA